MPASIYGQIQIGQDIDGEAPGDNSGMSVSLSSSGNIVAIGAYANDGNGSESGHVRVFENQNGSWIQVGQDIDGEAAMDISGETIDLSSDGTILAIGAPFNDGNASDAGHVRVFEYNGNSWVQVGQDIDGQEENDFFGDDLAISANGEFLVVSATDSYDGRGHIGIYEHVNDSWVQVGQDIEGESMFDSFGWSVAMSSNGQIVAAGARDNDDGGNFAGHVRVFEIQNGNWVQIGLDIDGGGEQDYLGTSVSLSANGSVVAVGAPETFEVGDKGFVQVYRNENDSWVQIGQDIVGEADGDQFGSSLSLSASGSVLVVGAPYNGGNGPISGHVRIYQNINDSWVQMGTDINGEAAQDRFGGGVSMSSDGRTVAIGAVFNDGVPNQSGHVRVFDLSTVLSVDEVNETSNLIVYPNPAATHVQIHVENGFILKEVRVFNSVGQRMLLTTNVSSLDISSLSRGTYIVELVTNQGITTRKLLIE